MFLNAWLRYCMYIIHVFSHALGATCINYPNPCILAPPSLHFTINTIPTHPLPLAPKTPVCIHLYLPKKNFPFPWHPRWLVFSKQAKGFKNQEPLFFHPSQLNFYFFYNIYRMSLFKLKIKRKLFFKYK